MNNSNEIAKIIEDYLSKKNNIDIDKDKLLSLFNNTELNFDDNNISNDMELIRIKESCSKAEVHKKFKENIFNRRFLKILVPSLTGAIILIALLFNIIINNEGSVSEVIFVNGDVKIFRNDKEILPGKGDNIYPGDLIETGKNAVIEISYKNTIVLKLLEKSRIKLTQLNSGKGINFDLSILQGKLLCYIKKLSLKDSIQINTPSSIAVVRGTIFSVDISNLEKAIYEVYDGKIKVSGKIPHHLKDIDNFVKNKMNEFFNDKSVIVEKNSICTIPADEKIFYNLSKENIHEKITKFTIPHIDRDSLNKVRMGDDVISFIKNLEKNDNSSANLESIVKNITNINKKAETEISYSDWKNKVRSAYLFYISKPKLLVNIYEKGVIEATDLKKIQWSIKVEGKITAKPIADGQRLFLTTSDDMITCIDLSNGSLLWNKKIDGLSDDPTGFVGDNLNIYLTTAKGIFLKINKKGDLLWKAELNDKVISGPVLGKELAFAALKNGDMIGVDKNNGIKIIKRQFKSPIKLLALFESNIYIVTAEGTLYCYNLYRDEVLWNFHINSHTVFDIGHDSNNIFIFNTQGMILKLDNNGKLLWKADIGNIITKNPEFDDKNIIIATDVTFYLLDKTTGDVSWSLVIPKVVSKNIAVSKENIYFISDKKGIVVLKK